MATSRSLIHTTKGACPFSGSQVVHMYHSELPELTAEGHTVREAGDVLLRHYLAESGALMGPKRAELDQAMTDIREFLTPKPSQLGKLRKREIECGCPL